MKTLRFFFSFIFLTLFFIPAAFAETDSHSFMTPRDLTRSDASSGIYLKNNRSSPVTGYGLYVRQYAYTTSNSSCNEAATIYAASQNTTAGSVVMPVDIQPGKSAAVGKNYLYNMIYGAIYYENIIISSAPPGCALPGCTWGADSVKYHWCIYLGALAPVSVSEGYTANVAPSTDTASGAGYNYNLLSSYVTLGPISCNDQALTCEVASEQSQLIS